MNHTKGPWKLLKFDDDERYEVTTTESTHGFYRSMATVSFGYGEPAETEQHANARLIVASPLLLEALKRIGNPEFRYSSDDDEDTQLSLRIADARAAISAAEGKS